LCVESFRQFFFVRDVLLGFQDNDQSTSTVREDICR